jgi:hypothetical protein
MPCPVNELGAVVPLVAVSKFEGNSETLDARGALNGERVLVARSGTACRAPTETKRTKSRLVQVWRDFAAGYVGAG